MRGIWRTVWLERVLALDLLRLLEAEANYGRIPWTYGTAGHTVEALLALDGDVGAIGSLELDIESRCNLLSVSACIASFCKLVL